MQRISGLDDAQVTAWEEKLEAQTVASLQAVMDKIARRIEKIQVASAVLVAADGADLTPPEQTGELAIPAPQPVPAIIPPSDLPPGQPYVSADDLATIGPIWQQQVTEQILPLVAQVFIDSAGQVRSQILDAVPSTGVLSVPALGSDAAERYLAQMRNSYDQIGDHLWATARTQLSEGFDAGESIPQLADRLRASAGLSARSAVLVARTSVIDASNNGSISMARVSGLEMQKEWIATPDLRTRPTHLEADGQRVDLADPFIVGGHAADYPADPSLPPSERYRCRCTIGYVMPDRPKELPSSTIDQSLPGTSTAPAIEAPAEGEVFPSIAGPAGLEPARGSDAISPSYVRPSLKAATTPRELRRVWQDEAQQITGFPFYVDRMPRGISMTTAQEYAEGLLQMLQQFPAARIDRVHWFEDMTSASYAQVRVGDHAIEFNMRYASEKGRPAFLAARQRDVAGWRDGKTTSWGVRNDTTPQGVVYHEFIHILDIENTRSATAQKIVPLLIQHAQREGIADIDDMIKRRISTYATENYQEMIAEAGTDVMVNGAAASQLSQDIFGLLRAEYRRRGFELRVAPAPTAEELAAEGLGELFPKIAKATKGSTIGDVVRGPTQFELAMGDVDEIPRIFSTRDLGDHALRGPEGIVLHGGERLPADFDSPLSDIRQGRFKQRPGLTAEQSEALDLYVLSAVADPLNTGLRAGRAAQGIVRAADRDVDLARVSEDLDSAIAASELAADTNLYRGAIMRPFDVGKLQPGAVTLESGFLSTTTEQGNAFQIINWRLGKDDTRGRSPVIFKILAPKGTHGAVAHVEEREVLLGRGRAMRVVDVLKPTMKGDVRVVTVELLPEGSTLSEVTGVARAAGPARPFAERLAEARTGYEVERLAPIRVEVDASAGSETGKWKAIEAQGFTGAPSGLLAAVTRRVRVSGPFNEHLRFPEGRALADWEVKYRAGLSPEFRAKLEAQDAANRVKTVATAERDIKALDRAMAQSPLRDDAVVWRGGPARELGIPDTDAVGYEWVDPAYPGVTGEREIASGFVGANGVLTRILVPRGTPAINIYGGGEGELLLARGLRFRVVADTRTANGVRQLDVEIVQPEASAVAAPALKAPAQMSVGELRAELKAQGITIPPKARKADLVTQVEQRRVAPAAVEGITPRSTTTIDAARGAEAKAVARQIELDVAMRPADLAIRLDELIANGASRKALLHTVDTQGPLGGIFGADLERLRALVDDPAALRAAVRQAAAREGLEITGQAGDVVAFDRRVHESIGGAIANGTPVQIIRPGARVHLGDEIVPARRAAVQITDQPLSVAPVTPKVPSLKPAQGDAALRSAPLDVRDEAGFRSIAPTTPGDQFGPFEAVQRYRGPEFREINDELLAGGTAEGNPLIAGVDAAMDASPLQTAVQTYRGLSARGFIRESKLSLDADLTGATWTNPAYSSTGVDEMIGRGFANKRDGLGVFMRIVTPEGTKGIAISGGEAELLLQRGLTFRVVADHGVEKFGRFEHRVLDVEVIPKASPVKVPSLKPAPPLSRAPLAWQARQDELRAISARPVIKDEQVYGGESAYTRKLEHEGGPPTITKDTMRIHQTKAQAARDADAEELGALTADAVGLRAPTVIRLDRSKIEMEFLQEQDPMLRDLTKFPRGTVFEETDDGRLMGLLDYVTGNPDRSVRNWLFLPDGRMAPIDMGDAFRAPKLAGTRDSFGRSLLLDEDGKPRKIVDFNPADLAVIRTRLEALRPEFERLKRGTWHNQMMARLADLEKRADPSAAIRLAESRPDLAAVKAAQRAAVRAQAATIATQRANAALLARVDELIQAKATRTVIRQELDPALLEPEQLYAGADPKLVDALRTALDTGDTAKLRAAITRQSKVSAVTPIGKAGARVKFDPATMEGVGGTAIPDGADVIVVRRGARIAGVETPELAQVRLARAPSTAKTVAKGDFSGLTRTSDALGGNPGGIFEAGDGSRWYVKQAAGLEQARSEALALDLYRAAGLDAPELVIGEGVEGLGQRQIATRFLDDAKVDLRARLADDPAYIAEVQDGFAVDAWLGNWDVVGANPAPGKGWDNIVSVAGRPVRIEAGGALRFRGLGSEKPFTDDVAELETMRLKTKTHQGTIRGTGQIFGDMTPDQIVKSAERVRKVTPAKIKALVKKNGLDPDLADTLIARRADILRRAELLAGPKPMTPREFTAAIKAAAKGEKALEAAPVSAIDESFETLNFGQQTALTNYRGAANVNEELREAVKFDLPMGDRYRADVQRIDEIMDASHLTRDVEVWRGLRTGRSVFGERDTWNLTDLTGFEWMDPAFSSTTAARSVAERFTDHGGVRMRMLLPKGSKAIQLSGMPEPGIGVSLVDEAELLSARGARFRVVRDNGWTEFTDRFGRKGQVRDLDVEIVVPDETPPLPDRY
jgi:hypothetical protein